MPPVPATSDDASRTPARRRVIAHCDVDAFYASVELLRRPELRGMPLVIAGEGPRSVVTTASYEARRFGVDSAMPAARARALCPQAVFLPPDFTAYRAKSREVWDVVRARVERMQQVGIDEAYLDVSDVPRPLAVLRRLVADVKRETGLVVSVGVGPSRLVAKTVSSSFKPAAFVAMGREEACVRFAGAPTSLLQGVGPKTAERLAALGVRTVADLQRCDEATLHAQFGERSARFLKARAHFFDESAVEAPGPAKSRSNETTFARDIADQAELEAALTRLTEDLCAELRRKEAAGRTIGIKVRLADWTTVTRARTLERRTNDAGTVLPVVLELFRAYHRDLPVRLLGVRIAAFEEPRPPAPLGAPEQLALPLDALTAP